MKFISFVVREIKYYVYFYLYLIMGEIFYVGKGKGNRVFFYFVDESELEKV